jgi:hypothetical protein
LQIATDKTEIILTTVLRIPKIFKVNIVKKLLTTSKNMKYLGIMLTGEIILNTLNQHAESGHTSWNYGKSVTKCKWSH